MRRVEGKHATSVIAVAASSFGLNIYIYIPWVPVRGSMRRVFGLRGNTFLGHFRGGNRCLIDIFEIRVHMRSDR